MVSPQPVCVPAMAAAYSWLRDCDYPDDVWHIETDNPRLYRRARTTIIFAQPIGYGGLLLTDPVAHNDLTTIKRLLVAGMSGESQWLGSGASARWFYRQAMTFVRWRRGVGISRTSELSAPWFELYLETLSSGGVGGLLNSEGRVRAAIADLEAESVDFGIRSRWVSANHYDVARVLAFAGLSSTRQLNGGARTAIIEHAAKRGLSLAHRQAFQKVDGEDVKDSRRSDELAVLTLNNHLKVWEQLWAQRDLLAHDALPFSPFSEGSSPYRIAKSLTARRPEKVPTPPAEQTCFLVDRAIRWVTRYADPLIELGNLLRCRPKDNDHQTPFKARRDAVRRCIAMMEEDLAREDPGAPWPLARNSYRLGRGRVGLSVRSALFECLPGACAIIIAAFTARRAGEIESLRRGCISDSSHGPLLECYIEKSLRTVDKIPVPPIVASAVSTLEWISQEVIDDHQWLFRFRDLLPSDKGHAKSFSISLGRCLTGFADYVGVPPLASGESWRFTPHQFRRFFAVTYYYRFKYRSLDALSHFLRHSNIDVTRGYVTETTPGSFLRILEDDGVRAESPYNRSAVRSGIERRSDFDAVAREFRENRLGAVAHGIEPIGGFGGTRLGRELAVMTRRIRATVRLANSGVEEEINRAVRELAARTVLDPHPDGHSYCSCTTAAADIAAAACANIAKAFDPTIGTPRVPDHRYASDLVCAGCPHNVQLAENSSYWTALASRETSGTQSPYDARENERTLAARGVLSSLRLSDSF